MKSLLVLLLALSSSAQAAEVAARIAVVPYQGAGAEPDFTARLAEALRHELGVRSWPVVDGAETAHRQQAAAMCGEDAECLATLGQRLDARWVLGFGVGKVGSGVMVSAVLVDGAVARTLQTSSERMDTLPADAAPLAQHLVEALTRDLKPPAQLVPAETAVTPPPAVAQAEPPPRPLRPWAIGTAVGAGVLACVGTGLTITASGHHAGLSQTPASERADADSTQRSLNLSADIVMGTAIAAGVAAIVLFVLDARSAPAPEAAP